MPVMNAGAMTEHLKEISAWVARSAHAVLILDGAGWHQARAKPIVPDRIALSPLPPYPPELSPMENVREYPRRKKLCALVRHNYDAIVQACRDAWQLFIIDAGRIQSIEIHEWACGNVWADQYEGTRFIFSHPGF